MTAQLQSPKQNHHVYDWIKKYQENADLHVQEQIIHHYKQLVESLARKYSGGKNIFEDLVQVGMIGLLAAIRRYDSTYGKNFEVFAIPTIIGEMKRFLRDKTWSVHVPRRMKELSPKVKKAVEVLLNELQRNPTVTEIAEFLNVKEEEVLEAMEMHNGYQTISIDSQIDKDFQENKEISIIDMLGVYEVGYTKIDRALFFENIFHVLTEREKEIINCTFFQNMSQKETGEKIGISQMHVSRIQRRALKKLREVLQIHIQ